MKLLKTKTTIAALGVVAMLAIPATTMAAPLPPVDGFEFKNNTTYDQSNPIGKDSSQITHNGWYVSGNQHQTITDQTTTPGSRAAEVQSLLGH